MAIKMLAIDLDGTLLTDSKTILPGTYKALQEAKAAGIKIVLTSGRPLSGIKGYAEELGLSGSEEYAILFNGAVVQNLDGRVLISHDLDFGDFNTLLHMQRLSDVNLDFETPDRFYTLDKRISIRLQIDGAETKNQLWIQDRSDFKKDFTFAKQSTSAMTRTRSTASGTGCRIGSSSPTRLSAAGRKSLKSGHWPLQRATRLANWPQDWACRTVKS